MKRLEASAAIALTSLALCLPAATARGTEIEGVEFATRYDASGTGMRLRGVGLLRYRVVFKGYVAALYLGEEVPAEGALGDVPRRLEIEYFWSIAAEDFADATVTGISRNADAATVARLRTRIDRLNALYADVEPGDRYSLTYLPGVGTELALNGEPRGTLPGAEFSSALFAIWLGERPLDEGLRLKLLALR